MSVEQDEYDAAYQSGFDQAYAANKAEAFEIAKIEGANAERARCKAIIESSEAQGRRDAAIYFATETDLTAEQAIGALASMPRISSIEARAADTVTIVSEQDLTRH